MGEGGKGHITALSERLYKHCGCLSHVGGLISDNSSLFASFFVVCKVLLSKIPVYVDFFELVN